MAAWCLTKVGWEERKSLLLVMRVYQQSLLSCACTPAYCVLHLSHVLALLLFLSLCSRPSILPHIFFLDDRTQGQEARGGEGGVQRAKLALCTGGRTRGLAGSHSPWTPLRAQPVATDEDIQGKCREPTRSLERYAVSSSHAVVRESEGQREPPGILSSCVLRHSYCLASLFCT